MEIGKNRAESNAKFHHVVLFQIRTSHADFCMGLTVRTVSRMINTIFGIPSSDSDNGR